MTGAVREAPGEARQTLLSRWCCSGAAPGYRVREVFDLDAGVVGVMTREVCEAPAEARHGTLLGRRCSFSATPVTVSALAPGAGVADVMTREAHEAPAEPGHGTLPSLPSRSAAPPFTERVLAVLGDCVRDVFAFGAGVVGVMTGEAREAPGEPRRGTLPSLPSRSVTPPITDPALTVPGDPVPALTIPGDPVPAFTVPGDPVRDALDPEAEVSPRHAAGSA
jgi:hypothetical protein